ncbi:hypothetical protein PsorP6_006766 [Peronosclerospora sorghi]|uniref:Uncharacterized protein n=1 Tax=Peronosclerospora sorghi TaxID=230839 RepID=A0ACC0W1I8_9STRA|nr:hypothetical protein PsorP6_006766 [Peronosclerospora sorghi]
MRSDKTACMGCCWQKFIHQVEDLKAQISDAISNMIKYEEEAANKIEQKLEQCDEIDLGLMDLADHQKKFSEEWSQARLVSLERRKQRERIQRQKDEEIARLHQEAIAESAMHAMNLEADINSNAASELQSLSKEFKDRPQEKETKTDNENELVWNPYVALHDIKRLVLVSGNSHFHDIA